MSPGCPSEPSGGGWRACAQTARVPGQVLATSGSAILREVTHPTPSGRRSAVPPLAMNKKAREEVALFRERIPGGTPSY
jgi:hypothetical protein